MGGVGGWSLTGLREVTEPSDTSTANGNRIFACVLVPGKHPSWNRCDIYVSWSCRDYVGKYVEMSSFLDDVILRSRRSEPCLCVYHIG